MRRCASISKLGQRARGQGSTINLRALGPSAGPTATRSALYRTNVRQPINTHLFSTTSRAGFPLSPEALKAAKAASITDTQYHELSDAYLDAVVTQYEELQDENGDIDVEFSSGVMTIKIPGSGVYVINKQPPNKQIWLSSPISGPKRFDYVVLSEGQGQKQDTGAGVWVYLRDGTTLSELLLKETGVVMDQAETGAAE